MYLSPEVKYKRARSCGASPVQKLLMVYSEAIEGCLNRDACRITRALVALLTSLDYSRHKELAIHIHQILVNCLRLTWKDEYTEVLHVLKALRSAWQSPAEMPR